MLLSALVAAALAADCPAILQGAADRALVVWVDKPGRRLGVYRSGQLVTHEGAPACFPVGLAPGGPAGPKTRRGDRATPEGWYRTSDKPWSSFRDAIAVHYPNAVDVRRGLDEGVLDAATAAALRADLAAGRKPAQDTAMGGEILLHGGGAWDWTLGCIALDDADLTTLRELLPRDMRTDLWITGAAASKAEEPPRVEGVQPGTDHPN